MRLGVSLTVRIGYFRHDGQSRLILDRPVSEGSKLDVSLWTGCIAGALLGPELAALVTAAGFVDVAIIPGADVFAGAPQHSSAAAYGAIGVGFRARKRAARAARSS